MKPEIKLIAPDVEWVESTERLTEIAESWKDIKYLAIDTEFERRTTFFAKLALVQVFDGKKIFLIDPLTTNCPDLLRDILENKNIIKIFHSCKEDLEVLYTSWNCKLVGLFDTQVAYSFLSKELSIGYAKLVEGFFELSVSKKETTSDWLKRPLSEQQKEYAAKDVLYLIEIFLQQSIDINKNDFSKLFTLECEELCANAIDSVNRFSDYRDAKEVWRLTESELGLFKELFIWRENVARENDRTKNHIIKDHELVELAKISPDTKNEIRKLDSLHPRSLRLYTDAWLNIVKLWRLNEQPNEKIVLNSRDVDGLKEKSNQLENIVKKIAVENNLNPTFLLSKRIIRKLSQSIITKENNPPQWKGWRKDMLQKYI